MRLCLGRVCLRASLSGFLIRRSAIARMHSFADTCGAAAVFVEEVWSATLSGSEAAEESPGAVEASPDAADAPEGAVAASAAQLGERVAVYLCDVIHCCTEQVLDCLAWCTCPELTLMP